jgi:hypothetical protein
MLSTSTSVGAKNPPWFRRQDQLVALLSGSECENSAKSQSFAVCPTEARGWLRHHSATAKMMRRRPSTSRAPPCESCGKDLNLAHAIVNTKRMITDRR